MKLGLFGFGMGPLSTPDGIATGARAAEDAGFDSIWAGEHVVLPDPQVPPSPMPPGEPALDPLLALEMAEPAADGGGELEVLVGVLEVDPHVVVLHAALLRKRAAQANGACVTT